MDVSNTGLVFTLVKFLIVVAGFAISGIYFFRGVRTRNSRLKRKGLISFFIICCTLILLSLIEWGIIAI